MSEHIKSLEGSNNEEKLSRLEFGDGSVNLSISVEKNSDENWGKEIEVFRFVEKMYFDPEESLKIIRDQQLSKELYRLRISGYIVNHEYEFDIFAFACLYKNKALIEELLKTNLYDINELYSLGMFEKITPRGLIDGDKELEELFQFSPISEKNYGFSTIWKELKLGNIKEQQIKYINGEPNFYGLYY